MEELFTLLDFSQKDSCISKAAAREHCLGALAAFLKTLEVKPCRGTCEELPMKVRA